MTKDLERLEAVLFALGHPIADDDLSRALGWTRVQLERQLEDYAGETAERGFFLSREQEGWILLSRPEHAEAIARAKGGYRRELGMAALETLAAIAYFEPVSRSFVDRLRGVKSERSLAILEEEGLIAEVGRGEGPGRPHLWATTAEFRRRFGLGSEPLPELSAEMVAEAESLRPRPLTKEEG